MDLNYCIVYAARDKNTGTLPRGKYALGFLYDLVAADIFGYNTAVVG